MSIGWLLLDGILVIIAAVIVVQYAKKGFLQALIMFVGVLLSLGIAAVASSLIAQMIYNGAIRGQLVEALEDLTRSPMNAQITAALRYVPAILLNLLTAHYGDGYTSLLQDALDNRRDAPEYIADSIVAPAVTPVITAVLFFVLFLLLLLVVKLTARLFKGVNQIPLVGAVNILLGGVLGLLVAALVLCLLVKAVSLLAAINGGDGILISQNLIRKTILFRLINTYNPVELLFSLLA